MFPSADTTAAALRPHNAAAAAVSTILPVATAQATERRNADRLLDEAQSFLNVEYRTSRVQLDKGRYRVMDYNASTEEVKLLCIDGSAVYVNLRSRTCSCCRGARGIELSARLRHVAVYDLATGDARALDDRHVLIAEALLDGRLENGAGLGGEDLSRALFELGGPSMGDTGELVDGYDLRLLSEGEGATIYRQWLEAEEMEVPNAD